MRNMFVALALVVLTATGVSAQSKNITTTTCPGDGCFQVDVIGTGSTGVQISGTFVGTVQFEQSINTTDWVTWAVTANGSDTPVTSATATGYWRGSTAGVRLIRIRFSAFSSGPAVVTIAKSVAALARDTATQTVLTTVGNIDQLSAAAGLVVMNNATLATIRGIAAGDGGQRITIVAMNAQVDLVNQSASAAVADRLSNLATSANSSLLFGTATYQYDSTAARWRMIAHDQGNWITPTYAAGTYTASGSMTWTVEAGDVSRQVYLLKGRMLSIAWTLVTTTTGGTASNQLFVGNAAWGGFTAQQDTVSSVPFINDGTVIQTGYSNPDSLTRMAIVKLSGANFANATNVVASYATIHVPVQ